jgi:hypothetical protein
VKTAQTSGSSTVVHMGAFAEGQRFALLNVNGTAYLIGHGPPDVPGTRPISDGEWHHVVLSFNGTTAAIYQDLKLLNAAERSFDTANLNLLSVGISSDGVTRAEPFTGLVDDLRIYDHALSRDERRALYLERGWR